jgi:cellobiose phosphorylase
VVDPCIPSGWDGYTLTYRSNGTTYTIRVENPEGVQTGVVEVIADGQSQPALWIPLTLDGQQHQVTVRMGSDGTRPFYEPIKTVQQSEE